MALLLTLPLSQFPPTSKLHILKTPSGGSSALPFAGRVGVRGPLLSRKGGCNLNNIVCLRREEKGATHVVTSAEYELGRSDFPPNFCFGSGSSAYQIEGAYKEGGKGPSTWDIFTHNFPEQILDNSNGDVAVDFYHRYKEDVKILKDMGFDSYRFSISWSRILPNGSLDGGINEEAIKYYNDVIDELVKNGIKPFVTLFHWDVPHGLNYGGFLNHRIVEDFKNYSELCFQRFGDRVKHWTTLNEPSNFTSHGYGAGTHAPGRCSKGLGCPVDEGNSLVEPYTVAHNLILAHAAAAKLYKDKYQPKQKGEIGISLSCTWYLPYSDLPKDKEAKDRALEFQLGWFMDPLVYGDYPFSMRSLVRDRLPNFTEEESKMVQGSYDFIGLNYYSARFAPSLPLKPPTTHEDDSHVGQNVTVNSLGDPISTEKHGTWIYVYPEGIKDLLLYTQQRYNDPKLYITENGTCEMNDDKLKPEEATIDFQRVNYLSRHIAEVRKAIGMGVNVKGYFAWCLTDNFEWAKGYTQRFGLTYIDFKNNLKRYPKSSAKWFSEFLMS